MDDTQVSEKTDTANKMNRGFWLTAFLILMFIANPFTAYIYFSNPEVITNVYPKAIAGLLYVLGTVALVNVVLAVGIWNWKKWGVYGFYIMTGMSFVINIYIDVGLVSSLLGLLGAVLVYLLTRSRWQYFT